MAESKQNSSAAPPTNSLGLKAFNQTGREDTTTEIIKPRLDAQTQQRNMGMIALVIVAFLIAGYITFQRSGLNLREIFSDDKNGTSFGAGPNTVKRNFDGN